MGFNHINLSVVVTAKQTIEHRLYAQWETLYVKELKMNSL